VSARKTPGPPALGRIKVIVSLDPATLAVLDAPRALTLGADRSARVRELVRAWAARETPA
jgi:hypothetical protein